MVKIISEKSLVFGVSPIADIGDYALGGNVSDCCKFPKGFEMSSGLSVKR